MEPEGPSSGRRVGLFYLALAGLVAAGIAFSVVVGGASDSRTAVAGHYEIQGGGCLPGEFDLDQSGSFVSLSSEASNASGRLRLDGNGNLTGSVSCAAGGSSDLDLHAGDRELTGTIGDEPVTAALTEAPPPPGTGQLREPPSVSGDYRLGPPSACLGSEFALSGSGRDVALEAGEATGSLTYDSGSLRGRVECQGGRSVDLAGKAKDRTIDITLTPVTGTPGEPETVEATKTREFGNTLAAFFIAVAIVMLVARAFGALAVRVGQPRVMGEVVAGIALGPTLLGAVAPGLEEAIFPSDIIPLIGVAANLGLIFYMFIIGLELDPAVLKGRLTQALAISNSSVMVPLTLGMLVALPIYPLLAPDTAYLPFALFVGVAMSITAFPVLARILVERRMLTRPVGAVTMAAAAVDDLTAWFLIALASTIAVAGTASEVVRTIVLAAAFVALMLFVARPLLARLSKAYDEAGRVPGGWVAAIFAGVLLSAYATETIGIALIFGAFVMGLMMPRHAGLTEDVTGRIEDFVVTLLLPLFFAYTGLRTDIGLLDRPVLWLVTLGLIVVAVTGKLLGAFVAARVTGFRARPAAAIGVLMNTRGLTELIVLNLALEKGAMSAALFAALVIMALATTFMTGPLLRRIDPRNEFGEPVEEEFKRAGARAATEHPQIPVPDRSILLAPQTDGALEQLVSIGAPLAASTPPRELILSRLVLPPRGSAAGVRGGLQTEDLLLSTATGALNVEREKLAALGVAARSVAFISASPDEDLVRVVERENVDLVIADGRRPLLGGGVPRGPVGALLDRVESDIAVLVASDTEPIKPGPEAPVVVPFGGAEHDWAALELGAWIAAATGSPLSLLGAAGDTTEGGKVTHLLGDASLLVQRFTGIAASPTIIEPGRDSVVSAAAGAGLLVMGLSARWRQEGLGTTRAAIASAAPAPILFTRRGTRPGALAPADDMTRFSWSAA